MVIAITQRSVLLSTNTKNAHIPLHNQSSKVAHQVAKDIHFTSSFSSSFFVTKKSKTSLIKSNQNIKHNGQDKKFIATAIVSGDNRLHEKIEPILNQNEMNVCHKYGIELAVHIFHHINQLLSAITLATYIYS